jgi:hypothetical protein
MAIIGFFMEKNKKEVRIINIIYYFNLLNLAALVAFIQFLHGKKQTLWTPRKGD